MANPRTLNLRLVDAQETRRILDRLYGYEVSPVLWKKVKPRLSAGRVQSVATRLVVERERERLAFTSASTGTCRRCSTPAETGPHDPAMLTGVAGKRRRPGPGLRPEHGPLGADVLHLDEQAARALAAALAGLAPFKVRPVERKPYRREPYAPFRTTTLQQEASRKLGFSAKSTMQVAQRLYENGFITYMRTDSITLSETAVAAARTPGRRALRLGLCAGHAARYASKVKNAQEAHEAIRPSGDKFRTPARPG